MLHPEVATLSCDFCQKYQVNIKTGKVHQLSNGTLAKRIGKTPCRMKIGDCPKGTPEDQKSLSPKNFKAYQHYIECKATGDFPKDAIVKRNAGIIRLVEDAVDGMNAERRAVLMRLGNGR